jgi:serine/threonine protein kinase
MGIVYEAEQESLGRHVALKILPFHRLMNPTHLERFRREARAAAQLHHTNIVPVFGIGEAEGVHYYAMQFIQGQGLDAVLEEVRRLRCRKSGTAVEGKEAGRDLSVSIARGLLTGRFQEAAADEEAAVERAALAEPVVPPSPTGSEPACVESRRVARPESAKGVVDGLLTPFADSGRATQSDLASQTEWQYCRSVAQVGVQVAEALAYAHKQRILHRDIKPSNLLLDTRGTVWITDFGLAKAEGSDELTSPGDIVGTVRFMAPERFQGKSDPSSDVYSLGITLYEMLTLRPAFADSNRARLVERVLHEEPPRLRELDPHIPRDLETIVLKATAKDPAHRYPSSEALTEDLRRYLNGEPIHARPVGQLERLWRWGKRNPIIAGLSAAVLLLLLLVAVIASVGYVQTALALSTAKDEAEKARTAEAGLHRLYYVQSMRVVQPAWESHNIWHVRDLLRETADFPERGFEWYYWQRLCHIEHLTLVGHQGGVTAVAFAPDGHRLMTGGKDCTARVWDADSGRELFCLRGHRREVTGVAFAPDGQWLATTSTDGTARIWDAASDRELRTLQRENAGPVWAVAVMPDGKRVVTGSEDRTARVWDAASGQVRLTLQGHTDLPVLGASTVALLSSPQGRGPFLTASALYPGRTGHLGRVWAVAATPDGRRLVTGSADGTARIWDANNGRELLRPLAHTGEVFQ